MSDKSTEENFDDDESPDEEVRELMKDHDLDQDTAEQAKEIMEDLGVDEDDAIEIAENLWVSTWWPLIVLIVYKHMNYRSFR